MSFTLPRANRSFHVQVIATRLHVASLHATNPPVQAHTGFTPQRSLNGLHTTVTSPFIKREMQSLELKDEPIESKLTRYTQFSSFGGVEVKNPKVLVANSCGQEVNTCNLLTLRTRYGLDGPVIESRYGRNFPHPSRPVLGPTQSPIYGVQGLFPGRKATWAWR